MFKTEVRIFVHHTDKLRKKQIQAFIRDAIDQEIKQVEGCSIRNVTFRPPPPVKTFWKSKGEIAECIWRLRFAIDRNGPFSKLVSIGMSKGALNLLGHQLANDPDTILIGDVNNGKISRLFGIELEER